MLFFIDESGHDHGAAPYEVLAAVAVAEPDLWNLIQAVRAAEREHFGVILSEIGLEMKGKKLLKRKTWRHAQQLPLMDQEERRSFARDFLKKGWQERTGSRPIPRDQREFAAYGQAAFAFVEHLYTLCATHRVKTFAAIVSKSAQRPASDEMLRRDYAFLFERFFRFLEFRSPTEMGLVVFDELEKAGSRVVISQMERYFLDTATGRQRSSRIVPEPFFVHSDLTTAVQLADLVAYCINWGFRLDKKMTEPTRAELEPLARLAFELRYTGSRIDERSGESWPVHGVFYLDDLRPKDERVVK